MFFSENIYTPKHLCEEILGQIEIFFHYINIKLDRAFLILSSKTEYKGAQQKSSRTCSISYNVLLHRIIGWKGCDSKASIITILNGICRVRVDSSTIGCLKQWQCWCYFLLILWNLRFLTICFAGVKNSSGKKKPVELDIQIGLAINTCCQNSFISHVKWCFTIFLLWTLNILYLHVIHLSVLLKKIFNTAYTFFTRSQCHLCHLWGRTSLYKHIPSKGTAASEPRDLMHLLDRTCKDYALGL